MELFDKIYSCYYQAVKHILMEAESQPLTVKQMESIVRQYGFEESALTILPKLLTGEWALLRKKADGTYEAAVSVCSDQSLTKLQQSWIKALLTDPKFCLFLDKKEIERLDKALRDVEPLYLTKDFHYFDQHRDRDEYNSPEYQDNFKIILNALKAEKGLIIVYSGKRYLKRVDGLSAEPEGIQWDQKPGMVLKAVPYQLQYSAKDDKFRLCCAEYSEGKYKRELVLNISRIKTCRLMEIENKESLWNRRFSNRTKTNEPVIIEISGKRNSLERCMLHFASYEKHTEYDEEKGVYICRIYYDRADETELLIEILSFGPVIRVLGPEPFLKLVRERVERQHHLLYQTI